MTADEKKQYVWNNVGHQYFAAIIGTYFISNFTPNHSVKIEESNKIDFHLIILNSKLDNVGSWDAIRMGFASNSPIKIRRYTTI